MKYLVINSCAECPFLWKVEGHRLEIMECTKLFTLIPDAHLNTILPNCPLADLDSKGMVNQIANKALAMKSTPAHQRALNIIQTLKENAR